MSKLENSNKPLSRACCFFTIEYAMKCKIFLEGAVVKMVNSEEEMEKRVCFICHKRKAVFTPDGQHNFVPHIIGGEPETICLDCKMELLQAKRPRNDS